MDTSNNALSALHPTRSAVIEACAGSGKTWLLVSRMIRLLLAGAEPSELLAITFTRKAAAELSQRVDESLARAGLVVTTRKTRGDDIAAACGQLAGEVKDRTRRAIRILRKSDGIASAPAHSR